jgi:cytosine deaminase
LLKSRGVEVELINDESCIEMMAEFINEQPELWHEDIGE